MDSAAVTAGTDAADMLNVVKRGALRAHAIVQSLNAYSRVNLLTNAVQAIGPAPGRITIGMHSVQRGQEVMLLVSDTGNGISPELLPRIFDPFLTLRGVGQGAGLGLCFVYGIGERHGGRIEVGSVVGQGTTFRVFVPVFAGFIAATQPVAV